MADFTQAVAKKRSHKGQESERPEKRKEYSNRWKERHPKFWQNPRSRYKGMVQSASRRKIPVEISYEEYVLLTQDKVCHYCEGSLPSSGSGLDRVDNLQGYIQGNCIPCCSICNRMKHTLSHKEFLIHMKRILALHG